MKSFNRLDLNSLLFLKFVYLFIIYHFPWQLTLQSKAFPMELGLLQQFKERGVPAFHTLEPCCLSVGTSELSLQRRTRA